MRISLRFLLVGVVVSGCVLGMLARWLFPVASPPVAHKPGLLRLRYVVREPVSSVVRVPGGVRVANAEIFEDGDAPGEADVESVVAIAFSRPRKPLSMDLVAKFPDLFELAIDGNWELEQQDGWSDLGLRSVRLRYATRTSKGDWEALLHAKSLLIVDVTGSDVPPDVLLAAVATNDLLALAISGVSLQPDELEMCLRENLVALDLSSRTAEIEHEFQRYIGGLFILDAPCDVGGVMEFRRRFAATGPPLTCSRFPGSLQRLDLAGRRVDPLTLLKVKRLPSLTYLNLSGIKLRDAGVGVEEIVPKSVVKLGLAYTDVTDDDLQAIAARLDIEEIDLRGTAITTSGLRQVLAKRSVRRVYVTQSAVQDNMDELVAFYTGKQAVTAELEIEASVYRRKQLERVLEANGLKRLGVVVSFEIEPCQ